MIKMNIKVLRLLFDSYSPLKTNRQLLSEYNNIVQTELTTPTDIRDLYNRAIISGFSNESVIKALFIEKFSFKKSPDSLVTVFELNTGQSRADLCMLNGKSMVYEIKTEFDTFVRLDGQITDYKKAYEFLNLIIPESKLSDALDEVDESVGIIIYSKIKGRIQFSVYREPLENTSYDSRFQLIQLTKSQMCKITERNDLSKDDMIDILISQYSKKDINRFFIDALKDKYRLKWKYLYENKHQIKPLDYQWFFKNNISIETVYR